MRYPRAWEADSKTYCASRREKGKDREYFIVVYVHRPGTPHHTRRISAKMNYGELLRLHKEIESQLGHNNDETLGGLYSA